MLFLSEHLWSKLISYEQKISTHIRATSPCLDAGLIDAQYLLSTHEARKAWTKT